VRRETELRRGIGGRRGGGGGASFRWLGVEVRSDVSA